MDLGEMTLELATPLVGKTFEVALPDGAKTTMTLEEALPFEVHQRRRRTAAPEPPRKRTPFSLYFTAPLPVLAQGMYTLSCEDVTLNGLFLVPIGADAEVAEYEAIFS